MTKREKMKYKLNLINPLTYLLIITMIPAAVIICIFTDESFIDFIKQIIKYIKGENIYSPHKFTIYLKIVKKVKMQRR